VVANGEQYHPIDATEARLIQAISPPAPSHPHRATISAVPPSTYPDGTVARRQHPTARKPNPRPAIPIPITGRPNEIRSGSGNDNVRRSVRRRNVWRHSALLRLNYRRRNLWPGSRRSGSAWRRLRNINFFDTAADKETTRDTDCEEEQKSLFHIQRHIRQSY
jgi:hypothetical protein